MDNATHTLFALTLARTPLGRAGRGTTAALVLASNAPDLDVLTAAAGGSTSYLRWHRGPTHGVLGVVGLGVIVAVIVWFACRRKSAAASDPTPCASLPMLAAVSMLGVLFHILMDLPTSYGTRLLSPFDWHWYAVDWLPIVDIYLLIALIAALAFGRVSPAARRRNAAIALGLMALNYGVHAAAHHQAMMLAPRLLGPTLPPRCDANSPSAAIVDSWPVTIAVAPRNPGASRCLVEFAAMPTLLSPFRWRIVAHLSNAYELHEVDLLDARFRTPAQASEVLWRTGLRVPNVWTPAVERAAATRTAQVFLGFSRFPAARAIGDLAQVGRSPGERGAGATVRWTDVRFAGGVISLDQATRAPFTVTIRIAADGEIQEQLTP